MVTNRQTSETDRGDIGGGGGGAWEACTLCLDVLASKIRKVITGRNEVVAKVMFLQVCVCPQGGRVSASVHAGMPYPLPPVETPRMERPPPGTRQTPRMEDPPLPETRQTLPGDQADPPREADSGIRSTSGRYASYWNAFLLNLVIYTSGNRKVRSYKVIERVE